MADFSFWHLFWKASLLVQLIIVGLFAASIWSWALIFSKSSQIYNCLKRIRQFETIFWTESSLEALYMRAKEQREGLLSPIFVACMGEWERAKSTMNLSAPQAVESFNERISRIMTSKMNAFSQKLEKNLLFLATLGSMAPFIGLLGTVAGIMSSFRAIAINGDTSLISVAPGIAEALFTTALGLAVAIPAVIAYNTFTRYIAYFGERADIFCNDFIIILLRQLHERHA